MAPENSETPLSAFKVLDHSSPEETHEIAVGLMNRHRMRLAAATTTFRANIHAAPVSGGLSMIYFSYGAPVEIDSAPLPDFAALHIPLQGRLEYAHGREGRRVAGPGAAAFFSEHEAVHLRWSGDLQLLVLRIHRAALARKLAALTGRRPSGPVVFAPEVGGPRHRALLSTVMTLQETVDRFGPDGLPPVLAAEYEELVLSMLLLDHDHSHSDGIRGHIPSLPGRSMRAAVDFVADHFAEPITAATLARAAHVSERTLYEGFQREFGLAPLTYVRRFRLERAREALIASAPDDGATVAEVAASHGFGHLGRFAASYRERYGESPSETLRR